MMFMHTNLPLLIMSYKAVDRISNDNKQLLNYHRNNRPSCIDTEFSSLFKEKLMFMLLTIIFLFVFDLLHFYHRYFSDSK